MLPFCHHCLDFHQNWENGAQGAYEHPQIAKVNFALKLPELLRKMRFYQKMVSVKIPQPLTMRKNKTCQKLPMEPRNTPVQEF